MRNLAFEAVTPGRSLTGDGRFCFPLIVWRMKARLCQRAFFENNGRCVGEDWRLFQYCLWETLAAEWVQTTNAKVKRSSNDSRRRLRIDLHQGHVSDNTFVDSYNLLTTGHPNMAKTDKAGVSEQDTTPKTAFTSIVTPLKRSRGTPKEHWWRATWLQIRRCSST